MSDSPARTHLRRELEAHLTRLGYSGVRMKRAATVRPEVTRVSPVRGSIVYGEVVLHADLRRRSCHERLLFFSQRRTRRRSSIPLFIAVAEDDRAELEALLEQLGIRNGVRGGHVQVVAIPMPATRRRRSPAHAARG